MEQTVKRMKERAEEKINFSFNYTWQRKLIKLKKKNKTNAQIEYIKKNMIQRNRTKAYREYEFELFNKMDNFLEKVMQYSFSRYGDVSTIGDECSRVGVEISTTSKDKA